MTNEEFMQSVLRTARTDLTKEQELHNTLYGLGGEVGELIDCFKKQLFQDHPADEVKVMNEVGDVLYYLYLLAHNRGFSIEQCMQLNKEKLKKRYPVTFSPEQSINRNS